MLSEWQVLDIRINFHQVLELVFVRSKQVRSFVRVFLHIFKGYFQAEIAVIEVGFEVNELFTFFHFFVFQFEFLLSFNIVVMKSVANVLKHRFSINIFQGLGLSKIIEVEAICLSSSFVTSIHTVSDFQNESKDFVEFRVGGN